MQPEARTCPAASVSSPGRASSCAAGVPATPRATLAARMAAFKPAYLIHGDDHGRLAERRARLRALAEQRERDAGDRAVRRRRGERRGGRRRALGDDVRDRAPLPDRRRRRALEGGRRRARRAGAREPPAGDDGRLLRPRGGPHEGPRRARRGGHARPAATSARSRASSRGSCRSGPPRRRRSSASTCTRPPRACSSQHVGERQQRLLRELEKLALELGADRASPVRARRRAGRAAHRQLGRAQELDARRRARRAATAPPPRAPTTSCARRARTSAACSTGCAPAARGARRRRRGSRPASRPRRCGAGCGCRRRSPSASSPTSSAPTSAACATRSRRSPTSSWPRAAAARRPQRGHARDRRDRTHRRRSRQGSPPVERAPHALDETQPRGCRRREAR